MTHAVVGVTLGTLAPFPRRWPFWVASAVLPVLPDLDVIGWQFGVPFLSVWGHRGMSHSLTGALVIGAIAAALTFRALGVRPLALALYFSVIIASHGLLDACTTGGPGIAFFAPLDETRYFLPWRLIPVSPLPRTFFSAWGWYVFRMELLLIWLPAAVVAAAALVTRRRR